MNESDDEKPKKKVKLNDSSEDENSSEDYLDSYDSWYILSNNIY